MGGRAEGLACADPGARTPISASGNFQNCCSAWPGSARYKVSFAHFQLFSSSSNEDVFELLNFESFFELYLNSPKIAQSGLRAAACSFQFGKFSLRGGYRRVLTHQKIRYWLGEKSFQQRVKRSQTRVQGRSTTIKASDSWFGRRILANICNNWVFVWLKGSN
jgi:hypothetical protein